MKLSVVLILFVLVAICVAKSSKSKTQKDAKTKTTKTIETKKHKDAKQHKYDEKQHKDSKKHKDTNKKHDAKKKHEEKPKKSDDKAINKTTTVEKKENSTKATLLKSPPSDCQNIIDDYSNGKILMYEYKIQMARCMKKTKDDADGTANADAKSALLRPDSAPREDTDQAIHVRPYNEYKENADDDDFETHHSDFSEHDNDSDKDYSDDDDDDDDDRYDPDEKSAKKMQVPATAGYQAPNVPMQNYNMPGLQQGIPGQQAASYYPNMAQTPYIGAPVQNPVPEQSQAAFAPSPMNQYPVNPSPFQAADPNMGMNAVAKNNIPENTQPQPPASQANAVFDQWRASSFGAATADKKDQMPSAPVAPVNDQFADFMKLQSSSSSSVEASPASQQAAIPAAMQQRSDVPQLPNMFPMQSQIPSNIPGQNQAYYMQPEEHGDFPENP